MLTLFENAKIYTLDVENPVVSSLLVDKYGIIKWVGDKNSVSDMDKIVKIVDLNKLVILPSFVDSHCHISSMAAFLSCIDLSQARSINELLEKLRSYVKENRKIIIGVGWDHELLNEKRVVSIEELNKVSEVKPIIVIRKCGHLAIANKAALKMFINAGVIKYKDKVKLKMGIISEDALAFIWNFLKSYIIDVSSIYRVLSQYISTGILKVHWMGVDEYDLKIINEVIKRYSPPIEIRCFINPDLLHRISYLKEKYESEQVKITGVKLILDGSLGARTAALRESYHDDRLNRGILLYSISKLSEIMLKTVKNDLMIAVHIIGDRALEAFIKALYKVKEEVNPEYIRIEHLSVLPNDLLNQLVKLKVKKVCIQPRFVDSDFWINERLGSRAKNCYRFKSLVDRGFILAIGSDAPVESFKIKDNLYSAIYGSYPNENERLDIEEVIKAYTVGGHLIINELGGILKPGYPANFIGLSHDPYRVTKDSIKELEVKLVVYKGKILFKY